MQQRSKTSVQTQTNSQPQRQTSLSEESRLTRTVPARSDDSPGLNTQEGQSNTQPDSQMEGVYIISVAARILDVHPQTLRKYERLGLINPGRTLGMLRLYSREDIRRVRLIQYLSGSLGLNLAGVEFALGMVEKLLLLRERLGAASKGTPLEETIEQELAALFESTGLPLED